MTRILAVILILVMGGYTSASVFERSFDALPQASKQPLKVALAPKQLEPTPSTLLPASVSAYAIDLASGTPLYQQNSHKRRPIASITKILTLYIVLSHHRPNEIVTVGTLPNYDSEDETLGLKAGQKFKLIDLAKAALIPSDNDAADALAIYDAGSVQAFTTKMNQTVSEWGIPDTHFASASGLNDDNNYTTSASLAEIAQLAITNPTLRQLVETTSATIHAANGASYALKTTDDLLASGSFSGIKTGYTAEAGQCFVGLTSINGHEVLTIVLGSSDRFGDTMRLRNWIEGAWSWQ